MASNWSRKEDNMQPENIAQRQLDAYNAHLIDEFCANFDESVQIIEQADGKVTMEGKAALREFYINHRFNLPDLHAKLLSRITTGNFVIDHEHITGLGDDIVELVAIYEVRDKLIQRVWFIRS